MPREKCVITGCGFYDPYRGEVIWGDLFDGGNYWILNGNTWSNGKGSWSYVSGPPEAVKCLWAVHRGKFDVCRYFERKGVIVIDKIDAELNQLAKEYLAK